MFFKNKLPFLLVAGDMPEQKFFSITDAYILIDNITSPISDDIEIILQRF